jgi:hypothetical protein
MEAQFETLERTKDVVESLIALGVYDDVLRSFKGRKLKKERIQNAQIRIDPLQ